MQCIAIMPRSILKHVQSFLELALVCTTGVCLTLEVNSCQSNIEVRPNRLGIFSLLSILCAYTCTQQLIIGSPNKIIVPCWFVWGAPFPSDEPCKLIGITQMAAYIELCKSMHHSYCTFLWSVLWVRASLNELPAATSRSTWTSELRVARMAVRPPFLEGGSTFLFLLTSSHTTTIWMQHTCTPYYYIPAIQHMQIRKDSSTWYTITMGTSPLQTSGVRTHL